MKYSFVLALSMVILFTGCSSNSSDSSDNSPGSTTNTTTGNTTDNNSTGGTNNNTAGVDYLIINSVSDAKGYTFKSNAPASMSGYQVTFSVKCDGSYYYKDTGYGMTHVASGGSVTLEGLGSLWLLKWQGGRWTEGADSASNSTDGYLMIGADHKLTAGRSCWLDSGTGGAQCPSSLYIESITQDEICN